jgi:hypothetical protein
MTANSKKSFLTYVQAFALVSAMLLTVSCKEDNNGSKDLICIKVPEDSSALGRINHFIPVPTIQEFRRGFAGVRDTLTRSVTGLHIPEAEVFNKKALAEYLALPEVVGLKMYYGLKPGRTRQLRIMIVGVDANGKEVFLEKGSALAAQALDNGGGLEFGQCPPPCASEVEQ